MIIEKITHCDDCYTDWAMWRKPTHEITLSRDNDTGFTYSTIRISRTPWDDFGDPRELPQTITKKLEQLVKRKDTL